MLNCFKLDFKNCWKSYWYIISWSKIFLILGSSPVTSPSNCYGQTRSLGRQAKSNRRKQQLIRPGKTEINPLIWWFTLSKCDPLILLNFVISLSESFINYRSKKYLKKTWSWKYIAKEKDSLKLGYGNTYSKGRTFYNVIRYITIYYTIR